MWNLRDYLAELLEPAAVVSVQREFVTKAATKLAIAAYEALENYNRSEGRSVLERLDSWLFTLL